jgi:hypothetical protein
MLEIVLVILTVIGVAVLLWKRPRKKDVAHNKPTTYVCPQCGEKDCHCERRS